MTNYTKENSEYKNKGRGAWDRIVSDKQPRTKRVRRPALFQYRADDPVNLAPIGTALVLFGRENYTRLTQIREALKQGDTPSLERQEDDLAEYFRAHEPSSANTPLETADLLLKEPVYAELRYESKVIIPIMAAPERKPLGGMLIPYTGGPLHLDGFMYEEYRSNPEVHGLEVIVVAKEPNLSSLERAMLNKVAASELGLVLGTGHYGAFPAALIAVLLMTLTGTACLVGKDAMGAVRLNEDEFLKVDPFANASKLLGLREQIILRHK
jgi:hypothetical protein